jgi:hypothetical protein
MPICVVRGIDQVYRASRRRQARAEELFGRPEPGQRGPMALAPNPPYGPDGDRAVSSQAESSRSMSALLVS